MLIVYCVRLLACPVGAFMFTLVPWKSLNPSSAPPAGATLLLLKISVGTDTDVGAGASKSSKFIGCFA